MSSVIETNAITEYKKRLVEAVNKMRQTDELQLSRDHIYDEALEDVLDLINNTN